MSVASQSGGVGVTYLYHLQSENIGLAHFVGLGNKLCLDETEYLQAFAEDEDSRVIALYLESVSRGRAFFEALRSCPKPVLVPKAGRTAIGSRAALAHGRPRRRQRRAQRGAAPGGGDPRRLDNMIAHIKGLLMPHAKGKSVAEFSRSGGPPSSPPIGRATSATSCPSTRRSSWPFLSAARR